MIGLHVHLENLHIFDKLCNFDNPALLQVEVVTEETPGYAPQVLVSKPRSAISHTSAAPAAPPAATEVQLYYETKEEGKYFCVKCHKPYKSFGTLGNHLRTQHGKTLVFKCSKCDTIFEDGKALSYHRKLKTDCSKLKK